MSSQSRWLVLGCAVMGALASAGFAANTAPVGGGVTRAGWVGEYFANAEFAGQPAFVRRDVRINHDWKEGAAGKGLPVGGATTPGMAAFPVDGFSVRWSGHLVPRFAETYTLRVTGKDGVRLRVREEGGQWRTLVDSLAAAAVKEVTFGPLKAGARYETVFEYVDRAGTGASEARLEWSSPSTPWEVIEPLSFAQADLHLASPGLWNALEMANVVRMANKAWADGSGKTLPADQLDASGWPTVPEAVIGLSHYGPRTYKGTYRITFAGQATVKAENGIVGTWRLENGETFAQTLPKGKGYSAKENTTSAWFDATQSNHFSLRFSDAEREPGRAGVADVAAWYPVADGAKEHHQTGEIYTREARAFFADFVVLRQHMGTSQNPGWTWDQRTLPTYYHRQHQEKEWGYCLEELVMAANDAGKDLHLCAGAGWDQEFMRKLAQLVRYGSDGVNPYDRYVENPKYPPLNPNLRIYLEHSNELPWAVYPQFIWNDLRKKVAENHPDWKIVNYDGKCNGADGTAMFRYHALRMKQLSDAFREVYADVPGAIGDRVRPLCFGQYDMTHLNTMLQFLDNYFNNGDGQQHVKDPQPPSEYLWGGGGAIYYGCGNKFGFMKEEAIGNGGFEQVDIPAGAAQLRPGDTGWTFAGNAGVCDVKPRSGPALTAQTLPAEPAEAANEAMWVGCRFTVGEKDLYVYQLGRWVLRGNREAKQLAIYDAAGRRVAENASAFTMRDQKPGTYAYAWCSVNASSSKKALPAVLEAGKTYYLVSREAAGRGADRYHGPQTAVTAAPGLKIEAAVTSADGKTWTHTPGSLAYGPVNILFTTQALQAGGEMIGLAPDESEFVIRTPWGTTQEKSFDFGTQCAFIRNAGSISREFTVREAGAYWITLNISRDRLAAGNAYGRPLHIKIDGVDLASDGLPKSGHMYRPDVFHYAASQVVKLQPGKHTLTLEMNDPRAGTVFIDTVHLSSEADFYGGPDAPNFPKGGNALGQNAATGYHRTAQAECEMARNWGLVPVTYEGGWAVQGDFDHYSMNAWNDLRYGSAATNPDLTKRALRNAFDIWCQKGGYTYAYFYPLVPQASADGPLLQGLKEMNDRLAVDPAAGTMLPAELTVEMEHYQGNPANDYYGFNSWKKMPPAELPAYGWKSWIVTSPRTAEYTVTLQASGGAADLRIDDAPVTANGGRATVRLTAGMHSVKMKAGPQPVRIERIDLRPAR